MVKLQQLRKKEVYQMKMIMKRMLILFLSLALSVFVTGCNNKSRYEAEFIEVFDTLTKIVAYTENKDEFSDLSNIIYDSLLEHHKLYDIYHEYDGVNNIKTINDNAGIASVKVDKKIIDLILFSKEQYIKTNGYVNIAFGSVLKIWHDYRTEGICNPETASLPPADLLTEASLHTDFDNVIIDLKADTVYLADAKMSLDVGAVAKGYAAQKAGEIAKASGYSSVLISVGGNVCAVGERLKKKPWVVGVENPDKASDKKILQNVLLKNFSLVTSGDYNRYYTVNGKRYHHIINPDTLYPAEYCSAVTILCQDGGVADALSTALFNMPIDMGMELIGKLDDIEALWVLKTGEIKRSKNFNYFSGS